MPPSGLLNFAQFLQSSTCCHSCHLEIKAQTADIQTMSVFFQASYFISEAIALSGIALNTFQIVATFRGKRKKAPFDLSVISLSIADIFSSCFTLFFMIYWHLIHNDFIPHTTAVTSVSIVCLQFSFFSSMFHLVFIAVQRVFAVISPLAFRSRFTTKFCYRSMKIIWALSLTSSVLNVFVATHDIIGYVVLASEVLLAVTYSITCCVVKKNDGKFRSMRSIEQKKCSAFRKIFLYSISMTFAFILCTLPSALYATRAIQRVDPSYVYEWVRWMFYLNPTVDSLLYFYFKKGKAQSSRQRSSNDAAKKTSALGMQLQMFGSKYLKQRKADVLVTSVF